MQNYPHGLAIANTPIQQAQQSFSTLIPTNNQMQNIPHALVIDNTSIQQPQQPQSQETPAQQLKDQEQLHES